MPMTQPTPDRILIVAYAYEVLVGDVVVDTWEETERPVVQVDVTARDVTLTFEDGTTETTTQRPGFQTIYEVSRLRSLLEF